MTRPKHPTKELESVIRSAEKQGWKCEKRRRYFNMKCGCGLHIKTVHVSPSGARYLTNLVHELKRTGCWKEPS